MNGTCHPLIQAFRFLTEPPEEAGTTLEAPKLCRTESEQMISPQVEEVDMVRKGFPEKTVERWTDPEGQYSIPRQRAVMKSFT